MPSLFYAQRTDSSSAFRFSGYTELYYSFDFSQLQNHEKPDFIYNHKRHNELNVNLAYLKASYNTSKVWANLALMQGNYAQYNLATEPVELRSVYEATVGFLMNSKNDVRLEAGIMPSHIGFESPIGLESFNLTRSIVAENSPYYETGIKLSAKSKLQKWTYCFLVLNGWQQIHRKNDEKLPAIGGQIQYKHNERLLFNYSNFLNYQRFSSQYKYRHYHNLYVIFNPSDAFSLIAGFDVGCDVQNPGVSAIWFTPLICMRYTINAKNKIAARIEYFNDNKQQMIKQKLQDKVQLTGASFNWDYSISNQLISRVEVKNYTASTEMFNTRGKDSQFNFSITGALCFKF